MTRGIWVLVCGPSGAGKDSVLGWAQAALAGHGRICFARRIVTRAAGPGSDHDEASPAAMQALRAGGGLAWHWQAHGHHYGVRAAYALQVAAGQVVVVNGSREHALPLAGRADVRCVLVTAPAPLLQQRLQARGREDGAAVASRMARNGHLAPPPADRVIVNDASVAAAGAALRDYLLGLAP